MKKTKPENSAYFEQDIKLRVLIRIATKENIGTKTIISGLSINDILRKRVLRIRNTTLFFLDTMNITKYIRATNTTEVVNESGNIDPVYSKIHG